jgi:carbonic anhydrase
VLIDGGLAAEIIFDQGLGDLFVVRTAGHVIGSEVLGSSEYGTSVLECPLVVVLGHVSCGAVAAAKAAVEDGLPATGYVRDVVERVTPNVLAPRAAGLTARTARPRRPGDSGRTGFVGLAYQLAEGSARLVTARGIPSPAFSAHTG